MISKFKYSAVVVGVSILALMPALTYAWGPGRQTFTEQSPAPYVTFNSITNDKWFGDERNFSRVRELGVIQGLTNGWSDEIKDISPDKTYEMVVRVHNNAAENVANNIAHNTRVMVNLPVNPQAHGTAYDVSSYITADNARPVKIFDNIVLRGAKEFYIKTISQKYYNNTSIPGYDQITGNVSGLPDFKGGLSSLKGYDLDYNDLYSSRGQGALIGFDKMDGNLPGCYKYSGLVHIVFKPVFKEDTTPPPVVKKTPKYDVIKSVDKKEAKAGDTINYTITVVNNGEVDLTNIKLTDKLPAFYSKVSQKNVAPKNVKVKGTFDKGDVVIDKLAPGQKVNIKISYKLKDKKAFKCGANDITNVVTSTTDQTKGETNNDNNKATTKVNGVCAGVPQAGSGSVSALLSLGLFLGASTLAIVLIAMGRNELADKS